MRRAIAAALALLVPAQAHALTDQVFTVRATTASSGATIPSDFVGLSFEVGACEGTFGDQGGILNTSNHFTGSDTSMTSLIALLGTTGSIRFGGSSSDCTTGAAISSGVASSINSWLSNIGGTWTVIYGLDSCDGGCGATGNASNANTTAGNLITALGNANVTFQFGNEAYDGANFTAAQYETMWNGYYSTIHTAHSSFRFAATDTSTISNQQTVLAALTPAISAHQFLSSHYYFFSRTGTNIPTSDPEVLLASPWQQAHSSLRLNSAQWYATNLGWANANSYKLRLTEYNSASAGGTAGASNAAVSAAWYVNMNIVLASLGYAGSNLHSRDYNATTPVYYEPLVYQADGHFAPAPVFYGMYLFAKAADGLAILPTTVSDPRTSGQFISQDPYQQTNPPVAALGTLRVANKANILVVNNSAQRPVTIKPDQDQAFTTATVLIAQPATSGTDYRVPTSQSVGTGCLSPYMILGGSQIGEDGAWNGAAVTIASGATFDLPPCAAALVQVQ